MTSEEKLLKLIRQKKPSQPQDAAPKGDPLKKKVFSPALSVSDDKRFDVLALFNKLLILICLAVVVYSGLRYSSLLNKGKAIQPFPKDKVSVKMEEQKMVWPEAKPFDYFQEKIGQRNLFYNPWEKPSQVNPMDQQVNSNFTSQLKLVGIVLDADPKAIIEDLASQQTFFLSKGDNVNNAVVQDILEDKVILIYNNQVVELTP